MILTAIIIYISFMLVDSVAFFLVNTKGVFDGASSFVGRFFSVFSVLIIAFIIAYLLNPLVDFFQNKYEKHIKGSYKPKYKFMYAKKRKKEAAVLISHKKRTAGTLITYLLIIIIASALITFLVNKIGDGVKDDFISNLNENIVGTLNDLEDLYAEAELKLDEWNILNFVVDKTSDFINSITEIFKNITKNIPQKITGIGSGIMNFFLAFFVAFYFLRDKNAIKQKLYDFAELVIPDKLEHKIFRALNEIHVVFSGYIVGQLTDAFIMSVLLSVGLSIVGVKFAIIIGVISGFFNIIPYFGAIVGFVLSVLVSLITGNPIQAVYAGLVVMLLQQIDGMFIVPKVVGEKVELSPVLVILSLAVFGNMFGIAGMIFAVPVTAILKIFITRILARIRAKKEGKLI